MNSKSRDILFGDAYRQQSKVFTIMIKPVGPACNLNCAYCYYLEKVNLYSKTSHFVLKEEILETFIEKYINEQEAGKITFVWQGGEPTMLGIDYFRKVVQLQKKYANGKSIENTLQTNGTLINPEWCNFLKDNNFLVGISIDGPEKLHDYYRKTKSNKPTFQKVMQSVELFHKYRVEFNTLSVVNGLTSNYPLEIYHFLKQIGSRFIQFIPIVERRSVQKENLNLVDHSYLKKAEVTEWSVNPEKYGEFLCAVFDEWVRYDVGQYFVQLFDVTLANWVGQPSGLCVFDPTCGKSLVMEHNGDVYSCDHFVYEKYRLGNIKHNSLIDIVNKPEQMAFGVNKRNSLPNYCLRCEYRFACHGECPKHRFCNTPDGESGLNYLCRAYKKFFEHVTPAMNYMTNELREKRPPANVMKWIAGNSK